MRKFIVDRIEDGKAVLEAENGEFLEIDKEKLPDGTREGVVLESKGEALQKSPDETEKRRESVRNLLKGLIEEKTK